MCGGGGARGRGPPLFSKAWNLTPAYLTCQPANHLPATPTLAFACDPKSRDLHASDRRAWMEPSCFALSHAAHHSASFFFFFARDRTASGYQCDCYGLTVLLLGGPAVNSYVAFGGRVQREKNAGPGV